MTEKPHDLRCGACNRKLGEGQYIRLSIKCPRCGGFNNFRASTPFMHAHERPTFYRNEDAYDYFKSERG